MIADSGQQHQLEGDCREVVVEEEDSGQDEVGQVVSQPPHQQHTATGPPLLEHCCTCVCVCVRARVCVCVCECVCKYNFLCMVFLKKNASMSKHTLDSES